MMKEFGLTEEKVMDILNGKELKTGMLKYKAIMDMIHNTDVSQDKDFRKKYNGFYRMGRRSSKYYRLYYSYMEEHKNDYELEIDEILTLIFNETKRCEISFCSKLLATINPNMPVWDQYVAKEHFGIHIPTYKSKKYSSRLEMVLEKYNEYKKSYAEYMNSEEAKMIIRVFNQVYPDVDITDVKKVDLVLWQDR